MQFRSSHSSVIKLLNLITNDYLIRSITCRNPRTRGADVRDERIRIRFAE